MSLMSLLLWFNYGRVATTPPPKSAENEVFWTFFTCFLRFPSMYALIRTLRPWYCILRVIRCCWTHFCHYFGEKIIFAQFATYSTLLSGSASTSALCGTSSTSASCATSRTSALCATSRTSAGIILRKILEMQCASSSTSAQSGSSSICARAAGGVAHKSNEE